MFQRFFAFFIILGVLIITFTVIAIVLPMKRFIEMETAAVELYTFLKHNILGKGYISSTTDIMQLSHGKYAIAFNNDYEALKALENLINDAFSFYNKIEWIVRIDVILYDEKNKLTNILSEIHSKESSIENNS